MDVLSTFLAGVYERLPTKYAQALQQAPRASQVDLIRLVQRYPQTPQALLQFLSHHMDGTYHREPENPMLLVPILGSDVYVLPYYLLSVEHILKNAATYTDSIEEIYGENLIEEIVEIDPRINPRISNAERLCFANCYNNGGTSQLMLDFHPNTGGTVGQVIRFLHDPDSYAVIATSFEEYLQKLMKHDYAHMEGIEDVLDS